MLLDFEKERVTLSKYHLPTVMKETGLSRYVVETFVKGNYNQLKVCNLRTILEFVEKERYRLNTEE